MIELKQNRWFVGGWYLEWPTGSFRGFLYQDGSDQEGLWHLDFELTQKGKEVRRTHLVFTVPKEKLHAPEWRHAKLMTEEVVGNLLRQTKAPIYDHLEIVGDAERFREVFAEQRPDWFTLDELSPADVSISPLLQQEMLLHEGQVKVTQMPSFLREFADREWN